MTEKTKGVNLDSADYAPESVRASDIPDEGITVVYEGYRADDGKFGEFFVMSVKTEDGTDKEILFSSRKLANLLKTHHEALKGRKITISGRGEGVSRTYIVSYDPSKQ